MKRTRRDNFLDGNSCVRPPDTDAPLYVKDMRARSEQRLGVALMVLSAVIVFAMAVGAARWIGWM